MAKKKDFSLAELQHMISSRQSELNLLHRERTKLEKELNAINGRIAVLAGNKAGKISRGRGRVVRRPRPKNKASLHRTVSDVLAKEKSGIKLKDLMEKVLATGYKTTSQNFKNVLYQCVYGSKKIALDKKTGKYKLRGSK